MSTSSKNPRIVRKHDPEHCYTESTYRNSLSKLMEDFEDRCAYCCIHKDDISEHNMEIDHHNPTIRGKKIHAYENLYPAFSLCNNAKRKVWPKKKQILQRQRFLDCCREKDYGKHIFEEIQSGALHAITPEGFFHIENCDLNNIYLKKRRRERTENRTLLATLRHFALSGSVSDRSRALGAINILEPQLARGIPEIPAVPEGVDVI